MSKLIITTNYGIAPNKLLNNENISLKAKGLFTFLQSKPDNWNFSIERISTQTKDGKSAIREAIKELENIGYLTRKPIKNKDGKWSGYNYILSEKPLSENRTTENPMTENLYTISNKDNSKKEYSNKDISIAKQSFADTEIKKDPLKEHSKDIQEILEIFYEINPTLNFANKTQRKAVLDLINKFGKEKLIGTVRYSNSIQGKRYSPVITTPLELKNKLSQLSIYYKKEQEPKGVVVPEFNF